MRQSTDLLVDHRPPSTLVVGCGLIGFSFALAFRQAFPMARLDGVEVNPAYREMVAGRGILDNVFETNPDAMDVYDLVVLAIPVDAACDLLLRFASKACVVMDVCSVKTPLCRKAQTVQGLRYVPSHPMAGKASGGPAEAVADLFTGQPWVLLEGFLDSTVVAPVLKAMGARVVYVPSAEFHDAAMAAVSHGVHLASISTILAYDRAERSLGGSLAEITGPGFRDVTRLASSPSDFWVATLTANKRNVASQLRAIAEELFSFAEDIEAEDTSQLRTRLDKARAVREQWQNHKGW